MNHLSACGILLLGFAFLILGADLLVRGASAVARSLGIHPLVIGLTIVAYGTSMPEFMASFTAMQKGIAGIAVGNVLGSNICNIALVLGIAALLTPVRIERDVFTTQIPITLVLTVMLLGMFLTGGAMSRWEGTFFSIGIVGYTWWMLVRNRCPDQQVADSGKKTIFEKSRWVATASIVAGCAALFWGGDWVVEGSTTMARQFGISERVIGGTLVALGTSLPELITTVVGILKQEVDLGVGNAVGSCIFNLMMILGFTALVNPIAATASDYSLEFLFSVGTLLLLWLIGFPGRRLGRISGGVLVVSYIAFIVLVF